MNRYQLTISLSGVKGHSPFIPCTEEAFKEAIGSPQVRDICSQLLQIREKFATGELTEAEYQTHKTLLKSQLPAVCWSVAEFRDNHRSNEDALLVNNLAILDIDTDPKACQREGVRTLGESILKKASEANDMASRTHAHTGGKVVVMHLTPTLGLRIVFERPEGMSIPEAQAWFAGKVGGLKYDHSCKDLARASYLVPKDHFLYINKEALKNAPCRPVGKKQEVAKPQCVSNTSAPSLLKHNTIAQKWLEHHNGGKEPEVGQRHNTLLRMASDILPTFGLPRGEVMDIIAWVVNNCKPEQTGEMNRILKELAEEIPSDEDENSDPLEKAAIAFYPYFPESVKASIAGFT